MCAARGVDEVRELGGPCALAQLVEARCGVLEERVWLADLGDAPVVEEEELVVRDDGAQAVRG